VNDITVNERLLSDAISQLKALDLSGAESVQINHTKYDDGSTLFEVGVAYPAEVAKAKPTLDELVAGITAENRHGEIV